MYKVQLADLCEDIAGFPPEIVEMMIQRQVDQGNPADVSVFQDDRASSGIMGGFTWDLTPEWTAYRDTSFWRRIIADRQFAVFYELYPTQGCLNAHPWP